jgi:hypothetical protein
MKLNIPEYPLKIRTGFESKKEVFDQFRKKYVSLTPEEWVRQHFLHYLVNEKGYPASLIAVEKGLKIHNLQKRFDAVVYNNTLKPIVLIEFKSPEVKLSQKVFDQVAIYNHKMMVKFLIVSNGLAHYCCEMNYQMKNYSFLEEIPGYQTLCE